MTTDLEKIQPVDRSVRLPSDWKSECCGAGMTEYEYVDGGLPHCMNICNRCKNRSRRA